MDLTLIINFFTHYWYLFVLFFFIATLYSSVGFGGGSGYLAVLALTNSTFLEIRATSLLCNIMVVLGSVFIFSKSYKYNWKKLVPLIIFSVPLAFVGGYLKINERVFSILLALILLLASIFMWISHKKISKSYQKEISFSKNALFGGSIGFISGIVGIGGGVFLAPLLYLINWDIPRKITATTSFFILVNSISGLTGQFSNPDFKIQWEFTLLFLVTVLLGSITGNQLSYKLLNPITLKKGTAILIAFVGLKILWKSLF